MRWAIPAVLSAVLLISLSGCGASYRAAISDEMIDRPDRFQDKRVELSGVPEIPRRHDFAPPNFFHKGYWSVIVDGQVCVEKINFENENRVVACRRLAKKAAKEGRKVEVKGKIVQGIVDIEYFEDIKTDTPWYKDHRPSCDHPFYLYKWGDFRPYYWWSDHYYGMPYQPFSRYGS